jgi:hypothetical protein
MTFEGLRGLVEGLFVNPLEEGGAAATLIVCRFTFEIVIEKTHCGRTCILKYGP